jgi:hypothetical protein
MDMVYQVVESRIHISSSNYSMVEVMVELPMAAMVVDIISGLID